MACRNAQAAGNRWDCARCGSLPLGRRSAELWLAILHDASGPAWRNASISIAPCFHGSDALRPPCAAAKLILISSNCPPLRKSEIEYYAMLAKTAVHHYSGSTQL